MKKELLFGIGILILAILSRFIPHPPNFTPLLAVALFGGAIFKNRILAFGIPLLAMFLSDLYLGLHESLLAVYLCLALLIYMGSKMDKKSSKGIAINALLSSIIFFLVTNFSVWAFTGMYDKTFSGLMVSYTMGLPFFKWSVISTLLYSGVLFGAYNLFEKYTFKSEKVQTIKIDEK